jgi:hypothetical protein
MFSMDYTDQIHSNLEFEFWNLERLFLPMMLQQLLRKLVLMAGSN